jgi:hypothetical protein
VVKNNIEIQTSDVAVCRLLEPPPKTVGHNFYFTWHMTVVRWQILNLMVEVLQKWEVAWKSPNRGCERTKYIPELK